MKGALLGALLVTFGWVGDSWAANCVWSGFAKSGSSAGEVCRKAFGGTASASNLRVSTSGNRVANCCSPSLADWQNPSGCVGQEIGMGCAGLAAGQGSGSVPVGPDGQIPTTDAAGTVAAGVTQVMLDEFFGAFPGTKVLPTELFAAAGSLWAPAGTAADGSAGFMAAEAATIEVCVRGDPCFEESPDGNVMFPGASTVEFSCQPGEIKGWDGCFTPQGVRTSQVDINGVDPLDFAGLEPRLPDTTVKYDPLAGLDIEVNPPNAIVTPGTAAQRAQNYQSGDTLPFSSVPGGPVDSQASFWPDGSLRSFSTQKADGTWSGSMCDAGACPVPAPAVVASLGTAALPPEVRAGGSYSYAPAPDGTASTAVAITGVSGTATTGTAPVAGSGGGVSAVIVGSVQPVGGAISKTAPGTGAGTGTDTGTGTGTGTGAGTCTSTNQWECAYSPTSSVGATGYDGVSAGEDGTRFYTPKYPNGFSDVLAKYETTINGHRAVTTLKSFANLTFTPSPNYNNGCIVIPINLPDKYGGVQMLAIPCEVWGLVQATFSAMVALSAALLLFGRNG